MTHNILPKIKPRSEEVQYKTFQVGSQQLDLPKVEISNNQFIYVLNILGGDPVVTRQLATDLIDLLGDYDQPNSIDGIVTVEGKAIHLAYEIALQKSLPYVVLRKTWKSYFNGTVISSPIYKAITSSATQSLYLDPKDLILIRQQNLLFVDDVISTGASLKAADQLVKFCGGQISACLVIAKEGTCNIDIPMQWLVTLPVETS